VFPTRRLRLTAECNGSHCIKNRLNEQKRARGQNDISLNFDFPATQSYTDASASLLPQIIQQLTDDMFNRLFSNW
jgi:hypothetical protein